MKTRPRSWAPLRWLVPACLVAAGLIARAHEGHKALPTKGARVEAGTVYLTDEARRALGLTTAPAKLESLERTLTATATVVVPWTQQAYVTTKVSGRLERIFCQPGDRIEVGQKLAELDSLELQNQQLELIQLKLELELADQTLERAQSLGTKGIVPDKDVRAAYAIKIEKSSALEVTRQKLAGIGLDDDTLDRVLETEEPIGILPIYSPVAGTVIHCDQNPGRIVEPTEHLFDIVDLSTVWVKAMVVESETYRLKHDQAVRVSLAGLPGKTFDGKVDQIALEADSDSHAVPVWVTLANPDPRQPILRPGMFGRVSIVTDRVANRVTCPASALVVAGAETYVFVQQKPPSPDKPGEYVKRNVVLGLRDGDLVEVKQGLFPGDEVVLHGSHQLSSFFVQGVLTLTLEAQRNIRLELRPVEERTIENVVTVNGRIEVPADKKGFASARVPGKVVRTLVNLADTVRQGQPVAEIESLEFQNIQLDLIQTQTRLKLISNLLDQARKLKTVLAEQEVIQREIELRKVTNQVEGLKRKLLAIGLNPGDIAPISDNRTLIKTLPVRSPISGSVVSFDVVPGEVVTVGKPLFEIHDMSTVWARGFIFENELAKVARGQPVRVRLASDPNYLVETELLRTNVVLNATDRVLSVWAELANPDQKLKDNMLARLTISAGTSAPVTAVPVSAVLSEGSDDYVFVKKPDKNDYFDRRRVQVGRRDDRFMEITSGLKPGELVAIGGVQELRTGYASIR